MPYNALVILWIKIWHVRNIWTYIQRFISITLNWYYRYPKTYWSDNLYLSINSMEIVASQFQHYTILQTRAWEFQAYTSRKAFQITSGIKFGRMMVNTNLHFSKQLLPLHIIEFVCDTDLNDENPQKQK
jgi:hypothetical protein